MSGCLTSDLCAAGRTQAERALPQWLTGLIAVTGFLFLTFVAFLVNRAWCGKSRSVAPHRQPLLAALVCERVCEPTSLLSVCSSADAESGVMMDAATYDTSLDSLRYRPLTPSPLTPSPLTPSGLFPNAAETFLLS